jgi:guanylate kinase
MSNLFIVAAPSGCGKTSLIKALLAKDKNIKVSISHTTRNPRPKEVHGKHYYFISEEEFQAIHHRQEFIEQAKVFDYYYGTHQKSIKDLLLQSLDVILEIDWQGARQVKKDFPNALSIFILPPSTANLKKRLIERGQDNPATIQRRMQSAKTEMQHYDEFDYLIINDNFDIALQDLTHIICSQRLKLTNQSEQQQQLIKNLL